MTQLELLSRIQEYLVHIGVSANVVIKGRDSLEIRMEQPDLMSEAFSIERPVVKTHVTSVHTKDVQAKKEVAKDKPKRGFNISRVSSKGCMSDTDLNTLYGMTKGYTFISATRLNTKVWENTCREIVWIASGLFVDSHRWDSAWVSKTEQKGGGPSLLRSRFKDIQSVIASIKECLDYIQDAHEHGNYWWPMVSKGKIPRQSIASFLVSLTRSGTEWSPFCEVLWEMNKCTAIKSALPKLAVDVAETIIKESPYLSSLPKSAIDSYWDGLRKFVDWYYAHKAGLLDNVDNRVRLADIGMAVTLVKEWNASASGRALSVSFIYPGAAQWFRFTQWCKTNRNVIIPDYRG